MVVLASGFGFPNGAGSLPAPPIGTGIVELTPLAPNDPGAAIPENPPSMEEVRREENVKKYGRAFAFKRVRLDHPGQRQAVPSDETMRCPQWEEMFAFYGLYPIKTWSYIAWRESRCRPNAQNATWDKDGNPTYMLNKNGSYDTGLLQINSSWYSRVIEVCGEWAVKNKMAGLKDLDCNLKMARFIMNNSSGGLSNWSM